MGVIIFFLLDTSSHLNASFKLAKSLQTKGHEVLYMGKPANRTNIESQGFLFHSRPEAFLPELILEKLQNPSQLKKRVESNFMSFDIFDEVLFNYQPLLILLDTSLTYYGVYLKKRQIPFMTISTKVCQDKAPYIPPFSSNFIPTKKNIISKIYVELIWLKHLLKKKLRDFKEDKSQEKVNWFLLCKRYLKINHPSAIHEIITKRSSHFAWENTPELILSPRHFDLPRHFPKNQSHMGPIVDIQRKENMLNPEFFDMFFTREKKKIYCSMGAYDQQYHNHRIRFFVTLINIFLLRQDWQLVIAVGKGIDPFNFKHLPKNVHLFKSVPQLYLLKNVDLMINHGGMQSVTECIMLEVPMIVYPLNPYLDQNGNAARVVYHNIGLRGKLKKDNPKMIEEKIDELLTNRAYFLKNIKKLREKMLSSGDFEKGMDFIENYIKDNNPKK